MAKVWVVLDHNHEEERSAWVAATFSAREGAGVFKLRAKPVGEFDIFECELDKVGLDYRPQGQGR